MLLQLFCSKQFVISELRSLLEFWE